MNENNTTPVYNSQTPPLSAMLNSKLFLKASTVLLIIHVLLLVGFPSNNLSGDDAFEVIPINGGAVGPESFDFNPVDGSGPYTGVSDGRIVKFIQSEGRWTDFGFTSPYRESCGGPAMEDKCGRPLGLKFHKSRGVLYVADAYFGLLELGPNGGLANSLVSKVQGLPLKFTNGLDIDYTRGFIYFTDSSQRYTRRDHILVTLTAEQKGSLLKYDLESKEVTVVLHNLTFPNGVALSKDGNFLLVTETTNCRILRFWLKTPKAGTLEVFADLPGYPDNIKINENGEFWVAMYSRKREILSWVHSKPWIVNILSKLPFVIVRVTSYIIAKLESEGLAAKLGVDGEILKILEDVNGKTWKCASEVMERDGYIWIGSVENPFAVKMKIQE
ncbi:putative strictosidine synthase transcription factor WD40-like family [Helianthus annuus]|uniref:Strictosidine synthase n=1 Tax=Helianthus annuus TaxID=4232 RepID=A0A251SUD9_HELAN|nr:protein STRICTOSIDINE SYNTHASE-LIKE 10 [Helianthus annuus]KAF5821257.1 putative strictosidine synthase [Helianthus annuus]KAJ0807975.1 putative strictosidine synthase transcription factor WD40-like family [Helianthus annuus]KAJ0947156.1 putative strictosidine synthase transcription factor WD40-like family [Helianthus annuus]